MTVSTSHALHLYTPPVPCPKMCSHALKCALVMPSCPVSSYQRISRPIRVLLSVLVSLCTYTLSENCRSAPRPNQSITREERLFSAERQKCRHRGVGMLVRTVGCEMLLLVDADKYIVETSEMRSVESRLEIALTGSPGAEGTISSGSPAVYPEFLPKDDVLPAEEQPLPVAVSPTPDSPRYIPKSDPEEDPEERRRSTLAILPTCSCLLIQWTRPIPCCSASRIGCPSGPKGSVAKP
ncbi:hypothetical protein Tco_1164351 [Tanacetum coccineum]